MKDTDSRDPSTGFKRYRVDLLLHRQDAPVSINVLTTGDEYTVPRNARMTRI